MFFRSLVALCMTGMKEEQSMMDTYDDFLRQYAHESKAVQRQQRSVFVKLVVALSDHAILSAINVATIVMILAFRITLLDVRTTLLQQGRIRFLF